jgi:hypothetical protein
MYSEEAGVFCDHRDQDGQQYGASSRYTLICLIGLHRARAARYDVGFDVDAIFNRVLSDRGSTPADGGLLLWASALYAPDHGPELVASLESQLKAEPPSERVGMNAGLALSGLVAYAQVSKDPAVIARAAELRTRILGDYAGSPSGLFFHSPPKTSRRTKPNFATQIYLMLGLTQESMLSGDPRGSNAAQRCATILGELQRNDGGWPWIYDTSGSVVEDYEIYSVHQDAMAPLAFLTLVDAGIDDMWPLVDRGLGWLAGRNDLELDMVDRNERLIYRSIRRPRLFDRTMLAVNIASTSVFGNAPMRSIGKVELNTTCRPYHLGWILEAWAGRINDSHS